MTVGDKSSSHDSGNEAPASTITGSSHYLRTVAEFFLSGGPLHQSLAKYETRPTQQHMANAVATALAHNSSLLVEAGTGTGKSLAYLVPALTSNLRIIVSTATRSLQDQLFKKELTLLQNILCRPVTVVQLKGTSNYLCKRKLHARSQLESNDKDWMAIVEWSRHTEVGDKAELASVPEQADIWSQVTISSESRLGPRCPYYEQCFVTRARRKASEANLVIVNHHLFFADLALRRKRQGSHVLPDYDVVIFDEAHGLEETITDNFGVCISSQRIEYLLRDLRSVMETTPLHNENRWMSQRGKRLTDNLTNSSFQLFEAVKHKLTPLANKHDGESITLPHDLFSGDIEPLWYVVDGCLEELWSLGTSAFDEYSAGNRDEVAEEWRLLSERCSRFRDDLAAIADRDLGRREHVFWGSLRGTSMSLHASPIGVAGVLHNELLDHGRSMILTSATLSIGDTFDHVRNRLGLDANTTDELCLDSPFDYRNQCLLYLARDIPQSRETRDPERTARIRQLLTITDGHALVLFTSKESMTRCYRALAKLVDYPLWIQGQSPRYALLEFFRDTPRSVLLATNSFWEGVDLPGQVLSQVLIDKLPFDVPSAPLTQARMAKLEIEGHSAFHDYQLPRAALTLKQGFGRLIRHKNDRGIVSILDPRIVKKRYGRLFLDSLPPASRTSSLEQARRWWNKSPSGDT